MTVSAVQILQAQAKGLINVVPLARACEAHKFPFYLGCVILDKETDGRNIFGHDKGGAFSDPTGKNIEVTEARYREFRRLIDGGQTSNGVGCMQITWKGYFPAMEAQGLKPWVPADNIRFGVSILSGTLNRGLANGLTLEKAFWNAAKAYNGNASYADDAAVKAKVWLAAVGDSDTKPPEAPVATERLPLYGRLTCIDLIRILPLVEYRFQLKGWIKQDFNGLIFQLTYGRVVSASKGTHESGAVLDVAYSMVDSDAKIRTWRECGVIMHPRPEGTIRNVQAHGHGCVAGCSHLSQEAQEQVDDYRTHFGNGLANDRQALGPHVPYITYQNALKKYAALVEEMNMPTAKEIVDEMVKQAPALGKAFAKGFLSADDIVTSGRDEPNDANKFQAPKTFVTGDHDLLVDIREVLEKIAAKP